MRTLPLAGLGALALLLAGCAAPAQEPTGVSVVASTDVYGDLVSTIGGDLVTVVSIIDSPAQDPHSYEASTQDQLAVSRADLLVMNGGGYDAFMTTLINASGSTAPVIDAVELSGLEAEHADEEDGEHAEDEEARGEDEHGHDHAFNEHVWYDLHTVGDVVEEVVAELTALDEANAATYASNGNELLSGLDELESQTESLHELADGRGAATTEPVPFYLLEAVGLHDDSPAEFTEAIEEGEDVPASALQEMLNLFTGDHIALLAYNSQTASPETERVREAAEAAGITVVDFTETLPEGQTYLSWMTANVAAIEAALAE